jgi:hypothetical protein
MTVFKFNENRGSYWLRGIKPLRPLIEYCRKIGEPPQIVLERQLAKGEVLRNIIF